jgi:glycosyltransferase involved in cell wall biosynthesis
MSNMTGVHGLPFGIGNNPQIPTFNRPAPLVKPKRENEKPKNAINYYGDFGGCGWWRMQLPETMINFSKKGVVTGLHKLIPEEQFYADVRSVRLQRQASPKHAEFLDHIKKISDKHDFKLIYEIDDIIFKQDIPDFNKAKVAFDSEEILSSTLKMMNTCDVLSVTCDFMKDYYLQHLDHDNIKVIPNMPARMWFDNFYSTQNTMKNYDDNKNRPRVLYAGSGNHFDVAEKGLDDDFTHVKDALINSRKDFKWVFLGSIPRYLHQYVKSGEMEFHPWTQIMNYPQMIHDLKINAVVAPLMDCTFNKAKSNIKYLESGCLGIPGVFQDLVTYKDAPLRFTDGRDMVNKLQKLLADRKYYAKMSKQSRMYADKMWLDENIDMYTDLYYN